MEQEQVEDPVIIESEDVKMETEPDYMQMEVKNPRIGKVLKLEDEPKRQNELEQLRSKRIRQQQDYINQMIDSVEANLKKTKEEQTWKLFILQQIKKKYRNCLINMR